MTTKQLGILTAVLVVEAALLLTVGVTMWSEPPSPAEEAVGKGLVTLGAAVAIPAFLALCAWLDAGPITAKELEPARSDWEDD